MLVSNSCRVCRVHVNVKVGFLCRVVVGSGVFGKFTIVRRPTTRLFVRKNGSTRVKTPEWGRNYITKVLKNYNNNKKRSKKLKLILKSKRLYNIVKPFCMHAHAHHSAPLPRPCRGVAFARRRVWRRQHGRTRRAWRRREGSAWWLSSRLSRCSMSAPRGTSCTISSYLASRCGGDGR